MLKTILAALCVIAAVLVLGFAALYAFAWAVPIQSSGVSPGHFMFPFFVALGAGLLRLARFLRRKDDSATTSTTYGSRHSTRARGDVESIGREPRRNG